MDNINEFSLLLKNIVVPEKTLFIGIGNILRTDDGVGSIIISSLKNKYGDCLPNKVKLLDAGINIENLLSQIINFGPKTVVFFDAIRPNNKFLDKEIVVLPKEKLQNTTFSTHNISLATTIEYLNFQINEKFNFQPEFYVVGIKVFNINFAQKISEKVLSYIKAILSEIEAWVNNIPY